MPKMPKMPKVPKTFLYRKYMSYTTSKYLYRKVSEILGILGTLGRDDNYLLLVRLPWTDDGKQPWCVHLRKNGKKYRVSHAGDSWEFTSTNCRQVADDFCPTRELTQTL